MQRQVLSFHNACRFENGMVNCSFPLVSMCNRARGELRALLIEKYTNLNKIKILFRLREVETGFSR